MAWLWVGQVSRVFYYLGVVIAVAAPGLLGNLPSISDLDVNCFKEIMQKWTSSKMYQTSTKGIDTPTNCSLTYPLRD